MAAVGYAKFTGKLGVCFSTAAPGAVHLLNGLLDARVEQAPLLAITGMSYHELVGTSYLQDINTDYLFNDVALYNQRIMGPQHITNVVDYAVRTSLTHRGPSHLAEDVAEAAAEQGLNTVRLRLRQPEDASPLIAGPFQDWYGRNGRPASRLLVSSFLLMDPLLAIRTGSVPYWALFGTQSSQDRLAGYLSRAHRYDDIRMTVFPHGTDSIGLASWRIVHRSRPNPPPRSERRAAGSGEAERKPGRHNAPAGSSTASSENSPALGARPGGVTQAAKLGQSLPG
jgi:Thiamine pyrophosphate enzyme, N-terminal TPP binding domain